MTPKRQESTARRLERAIDGLIGAKEIGGGGFAVVYRGHQPALGRSVAIKVLTTSVRRAEDRERFEREARAMGALSGHPAIVQLYAVGVLPDGRPYLLMEDMRGGSLADRLGRQHLDPDEATALGVRLAGALTAAHRGGILHCDVTPRNVLASRFGDWRLGDFGIVRLLEGSVAEPQGFAGSLAYAAPEVFRGEAATPAVDVYGLAATLYEAIAGSPPCDSSGEARAIAARRGVDSIQVRPPAAAPQPLANVILTGLATRPTSRWATPRTFAMALNRARVESGLSAIPLSDPAGDDAVTLPAKRAIGHAREESAVRAKPRRALALAVLAGSVLVGTGGGAVMGSLLAPAPSESQLAASPAGTETQARAGTEGEATANPDSDAQAAPAADTEAGADATSPTPDANPAPVPVVQAPAPQSAPEPPPRAAPAASPSPDPQAAPAADPGPDALDSPPPRPGDGGGRRRRGPVR